MKERYHPQIKPQFLAALQRDGEWLAKKCKMQTSFPNVDTFDVDVLQAFVKEAFTLLGINKISGYVKTTNRNVIAKTILNKMWKSWRLKRRNSSANGRYSSRCNTANFATRAKQQAGLEPITRYERVQVVRSKTCVAKFEMLKFNDLMKTKKHPLRYHPDYLRAVRFVSKLCGRIKNFMAPYTTAKALMVGKLGLVHDLLEEFVVRIAGSEAEFQRRFPITVVCLKLLSAELGARKAFTLQSHERGSLNTHLMSILMTALALEREAVPTLALMLPKIELFALIPDWAKKRIFDTFEHVKPMFLRFLNEQWTRGVKKSARRQMRVRPRGSKINSAGWNVVVDAWNAMVRFYAALRASNFDTPIHIKFLQLIANDQFRWGGMVGKLMPADVYIFDQLTRSGVIDQILAEIPVDIDAAFATLWTQMSTRSIPKKLVEQKYSYYRREPDRYEERSAEEQAEIRAKDQRSCSARNWTGGNCKLWTSEKVHERVDMICGCAVPAPFVELGKALNWYGSNGWIGASTEDTSDEESNKDE